MAEIGLTITDSITYFIRQSLRERMRTGKNYHAIRKQLEALDASIKEELLAQSQQEKVLLEIRGNNTNELEESFEAVKKQAHALSATGKQAFIVQTPMLLEEGEILITVNTAQWNKDSAVEMLESISKGVHPLIAQTHQLAQEITEFYTNIKTA